MVSAKSITKNFQLYANQSEKLKSTLIYLIENSEVIKKISVRAKEIYNLLSWEIVLEEYEGFYNME